MNSDLLAYRDWLVEKRVAELNDRQDDDERLGSGGYSICLSLDTFSSFSEMLARRHEQEGKMRRDLMLVSDSDRAEHMSVYWPYRYATEAVEEIQRLLQVAAGIITKPTGADVDILELFLAERKVRA